MGPWIVPYDVGSSSQKMRGAVGQRRLRRCMAMRSRGRSKNVAQPHVPRVSLPSDSSSWTPDQRDDFKRFRYSVGDVIFDSCKARPRPAHAPPSLPSLLLTLPP